MEPEKIKTNQKAPKSLLKTMRGPKGIITLTALFSTLPVWGPWISNALTWQLSLRDRREAVLKSYLAEMSSMLIDPKRSTFEGDNDAYAQSVARALSLNTLKAFQSPMTLPIGWLSYIPGLKVAEGDEIPLFESMLEDRRSKEEVVRFLYESKLLGYCTPKKSALHPGSIILDPDLIEVVPSEVNLSGANFKRISFRKIGHQLCGIDLSNTTLEGASLEKVDVKKARFTGADLKGVNFRSASLNQASLDRADLRGILVDGDTQVVGVSIAGALICGTDFSALNQNAVREESSETQRQELHRNKVGLYTGELVSGKVSPEIQGLRETTLDLFTEKQATPTGPDQTSPNAVSKDSSRPSRRTIVEISTNTKFPALLTPAQIRLIRDGYEFSSRNDVTGDGGSQLEPCFAKTRPS